jgi:hypothetical protein
MLLIVTTDRAGSSVHSGADFMTGRLAAVSDSLSRFGYRLDRMEPTPPQKLAVEARALEELKKL